MNRPYRFVGDLRMLCIPNTHAQSIFSHSEQREQPFGEEHHTAAGDGDLQQAHAEVGGERAAKQGEEPGDRAAGGV